MSIQKIILSLKGLLMTIELRIWLASDIIWSIWRWYWHPKSYSHHKYYGQYKYCNSSLNLDKQGKLNSIRIKCMSIHVAIFTQTFLQWGSWPRVGKQPLQELFPFYEVISFKSLKQGKRRLKLEQTWGQPGAKTLWKIPWERMTQRTTQLLQIYFNLKGHSTLEYLFPWWEVCWICPEQSQI